MESEEPEMNTETAPELQAIAEAANGAAPNPLQALAKLAMPSTDAITKPSSTYVNLAKSLVIEDDVDREFAVGELQAIAGAIKTLESQRTAITGPINEGLKAINAMFAGPKSALEGAQTMLKATVLTYDKAQAAIAEAARIKAANDAREAAEKAQKEAAERASKAEAEARELQAAAEVAAASGNNEQALILEVQAASVASVAQEEAANVQMSVFAPPPAVAAPVKKGTATRTKWSAELVDMVALVKHIAQNPDLIGLLELNQSAANKMASALQSSMKVPGLRVTADQSLSVRASK